MQYTRFLYRTEPITNEDRIRAMSDEELENFINNFNICDRYSTMMMYEIADAIMDAPAADVAPVRHGRWLDVQETDMYLPDLKLTVTETAETCSVCKARIGFIGAKLYLFDSICPNCGAMMDGGSYYKLRGEIL